MLYLTYIENVVPASIHVLSTNIYYVVGLTKYIIYGVLTCYIYFLPTIGGTYLPSFNGF